MSEFYGEWSGDEQEDNQPSTITNEKPEIKEIKKFIKNNTNQNKIVENNLKCPNNLNKNNVSTANL